MIDHNEFAPSVRNCPPPSAIFEVIRGWGVKHIFTCPGSTEAPFLDASLKYSDIQIILATHESAAVAMADGLARSTGQPAVVYLHVNVGLANGITNVFAAQLAGSPLVILNGLKPTQIQSHGAFTTVPHIRDLVRQHVKWDWQTLDAEAVGEDVNRAFRIATSQPMGPTWVGLPQNLMESTDEIPVPDVARFIVRGYARPSHTAIQAAAALLRQARRPLIVAGGEVAKRAAVERVERLAAHLVAPVMSESQWTIERSSFSSKNPHYGGVYSGSRASVRSADVIFLAGSGSIVEFEPPVAPEFPSTARIIHNHPNPLEIGKVYGVDVAVVGDAKYCLDDLLDALQEDAPKGQLRADRLEHLQRTTNEYSVTCNTIHERALVRSNGLNVPAIVKELVEFIGRFPKDGATVVGDAVTASSTLFELLPVSEALDYHRSSGGALGWGMGAALGFKLGDPNRHVIAVVGDGVFQFGVQALWTAAHLNLSVTYLVINNGAYAAVRASMYRFDGEARRAGVMPATDISGADVVGICGGFGIAGRRVENTVELREALIEGRRRQSPFVIEAISDPKDLGLRQYASAWQDPSMNM